MVTAAKLEAAKNNWKVSIAVVDEGGYLLHLERMDGAVLMSPEIATLKARQAEFDSPAEYARNGTVCGGRINNVLAWAQ